MVSALERKLLRNLVELKGQVLTIALVVACGIASYVSMRSTWGSLVYSKNTYYERYHFADLFVGLERAPESLARRIEQLPGVSRVATRVVENVMLPLASLPEPATGNLVSLSGGQVEPMNRLHLHSGRLPNRHGEVVLLHTFARANAVSLGDRLPVIINGKLRRPRVVGTAVSPEYVFAMAPGELTIDEKRFAVIWMLREEVAPSYQMEGAFNDLTLKLEPGASALSVVERVDDLLRPYGGRGAVLRARQTSNFMLESELSELGAMANVMPFIFLSVAAFLLNVVLARLVNLQRAQIATLLALGYRQRSIALHYLELVTAVVLLGAAAGVGLGAWGGQAWTQFYGRFFKFPVLRYHLDTSLLVTSVLLSLGAACFGALSSARRIARMPPAEAMRPPAPLRYRISWLERLGAYRWLGPSARMVAREVERHPLRVLVSSVGIAMAVGILVVARFWSDAIEFLIDVQFHRSMREDTSVMFANPQPERAIRELSHIPGVLYAEGLAVTAVRLGFGARHRDVPLYGYSEPSELRHILDKWGNQVSPPSQGVMLTRKLGEILGVAPGQAVEVEVRQGDRRRTTLRVVDFVDESFGLQGHMSAESLAKLLGNAGTVSMALLQLDPLRSQSVHERLKELPGVVSVTRRDNLWERFQAQSASMMLAFTFVASLLAAVIAVGVVYNNARVALSMRSRDLASLRVLGFTRREISAILLGELGVQVLLAIPIGLVVGTYMARAMMANVDPETYRFPVIISSRTYTFAVVITLAAGLLSALMVRRKLDRLDLIGVLKTRE